MQNYHKQIFIKVQLFFSTQFLQTPIPPLSDIVKLALLNRRFWHTFNRCQHVGKSYLACALGHRACLEGYRVVYHRTPRLLGALAMAKGDGSYAKLLEKWKKTDLLILDDWGISPLTSEHCRDLLEILEDRYQKSSTLITSQLPFDHWHKTMKSPTLADAILDRLFHNAYRIVLKGESKRKTKDQPVNSDPG